jgi:DNA-binding CsgD family transcriptional regulator
MDDSRRQKPPGPRSTAGALERGREKYAARAWAEAYDLLDQADREVPLADADLECLTWAAALSGRDPEAARVLERLYKSRLEAGDEVGATRAAFWLGMAFIALGEVGRAGGWLGRAQTLVDRRDDPCVECGYLLLPAARKDIASGNYTAAHDMAAEAVEIGKRFGDDDLVAFGRALQATSLTRRGLTEGVVLLDEALVVTTSETLSPMIAGLVYCLAIPCCQEVHAVERAREWTSEFVRWCSQQPQLGGFSGTCLVHRSEVLQQDGAWSEAIQDAQRASETLSPDTDPQALGGAFYQQAEIYRLQGDFDEAEEAYRRASQLGRDPQPGLALLRLAQRRLDSAANAVRRAVGDAKHPAQHMRLLPAHLEIMLAVEDFDGARDACRRLDEMAAQLGTEVSGAMSSHAVGALRLAEGDAQAAVTPLRAAFQTWQQMGVPYVAARVRVLLGRACRLLGDEDGAMLELDAARKVFEVLGARPDVARIDALKGERASAPSDERHSRLSPRELQVLRLVASGKTNKAIAKELRLSEKTIEHHVSHILTKLDVPSRAAATAYGYEHELI